MLPAYNQGNKGGMRYMFNKPPKWNEEVQAFVLNFNGRVEKPSVKNFQLIQEDDGMLAFRRFCARVFTCYRGQGVSSVW